MPNIQTAPRLHRPSHNIQENDHDHDHHDLPAPSSSASSSSTTSLFTRITPARPPHPLRHASFDTALRHPHRSSSWTSGPPSPPPHGHVQVERDLIHRCGSRPPSRYHWDPTRSSRNHTGSSPDHIAFSIHGNDYDHDHRDLPAPSSSAPSSSATPRAHFWFSPPRHSLMAMGVESNTSLSPHGPQSSPSTHQEPHLLHEASTASRPTMDVFTLHHYTKKGSRKTTMIPQHLHHWRHRLQQQVSSRASHQQRHHTHSVTQVSTLRSGTQPFNFLAVRPVSIGLPSASQNNGCPSSASLASHATGGS